MSAPAPAATSFDAATAVAPLGDGRYAGQIAPAWAGPAGPNGGYLAALVLRALQAEVHERRRAPRTLACHYLRRVTDGPCTIAVTVERAGRTLTSLSARLEQDGQTRVLALAAFSDDFPAADVFAPPAPVVAPPARLASRTDNPMRAIGESTVVEQRFGAPVLSGAQEAVSGGWLRMTEPRVTDAIAVALYADAWVPAVWGRLQELLPVPTVDLTIHFRARLPVSEDPAEPVLVRVGSTAARDGFVEEDGEVWSAGGVLLAQSRQLAILRPA